MTSLDARVGGTGFIKVIPQTIPGGSGSINTVITPTNSVPVTSDKLMSPFDMAQEKVMLSSRFTNEIQEPLRVKPAGPVEWWMNAVLGIDFPYAALGAKSTISAIAAVATTADSTTTNNVTTLTAAGAWVPGTHVIVNCDNAGLETATSLPRIALYGSGAGTLKVKDIEQTLATGAFVTQPAQTKIANSLLPTGHLLELPTLTVESNKGQEWSWLYPACFVDKFSLDYGAALVKAHADLVAAGGMPVFRDGSTTPTMGTFNPTGSDLTAALQPFNGGLTTVSYVSDPDATGTVLFQPVDLAVSMKMEYDNHVISEPIMNGKQQYGYWPGDSVDCKFTWEAISTSKRPIEWEQLLKNNTPSPVQVHSWRNTGTDIAPVTRGLSLYAGNCKFTMADFQGDMGKMNRTSLVANAKVVPGGAQDLVTLYIL